MPEADDGPIIIVDGTPHLSLHWLYKHNPAVQMLVEVMALEEFTKSCEDKPIYWNPDSNRGAKTRSQIRKDSA